MAIAAGVCSALGAVHDKGIVHRDVKPSNIFLARRPDGGADPKLLDFGVAKRISVPPDTVRRVTKRYGERHGTPAPTAANMIVGTPRYLSPEQILGHKVDARSDVWALSATLYEALGGAPAFAGATLSELLEKIVVEAPAPLAPLGVAPALDRVLTRALAKEPADCASRARPTLHGALGGARRGAAAGPDEQPDPGTRRCPSRGTSDGSSPRPPSCWLAVLAVTFGRSRPAAASPAASTTTAPATPAVARARAGAAAGDEPRSGGRVRRGTRERPAGAEGQGARARSPGSSAPPGPHGCARGLHRASRSTTSRPRIEGEHRCARPFFCPSSCRSR